jgi:hypothetical protein
MHMHSLNLYCRGPHGKDGVQEICLVLLVTCCGSESMSKVWIRFFVTSDHIYFLYATTIHFYFAYLISFTFCSCIMYVLE